MFKPRQMKTEKQKNKESINTIFQIGAQIKACFPPSATPSSLLTLSSNTEHHSAKNYHSPPPQPQSTLTKGDEALKRHS